MAISIFRRLFSSKQSRRKHARKQKAERKVKKTTNKEAKQALKLYKKEYKGRQSLIHDVQKEIKSGSYKLPDITKNPLYRQANDFISSLVNPSAQQTAAYQAPALRQFREQILPGIAEQYAGLGDTQLATNPAFANASVGAGADLAERLALQKTQAGLAGTPYAFQSAQQPITNRQQEFANKLALQQQTLSQNTANQVAFPSPYQEAANPWLAFATEAIPAAASAAGNYFAPGSGQAVGAATKGGIKAGTGQYDTASNMATPVPSNLPFNTNYQPPSTGQSSLYPPSPWGGSINAGVS